MHLLGAWDNVQFKRLFTYTLDVAVIPTDLRWMQGIGQDSYHLVLKLPEIEWVEQSGAWA